jgi:hypothetical protein
MAWLGGVSMKEPRALFVLAPSFSLCVSAKLLKYVKNLERENALVAMTAASLVVCLFNKF